MISAIVLKIGIYSGFHRSSRFLIGFYTCHNTDKSFKTLYGFGGRCVKIVDVWMYFEPCFKAITWSQLSTLSDDQFQHDLSVVLNYRFVKSQNSPQNILQCFV